MIRRYPYDLHIHSCLSPCGDDDMTAWNIAGMASLNGLAIAALTDHNTCRNCPAFFKACEKLRHRAGRRDGADHGGGDTSCVSVRAA